MKKVILMTALLVSGVVNAAEAPDCWKFRNPISNGAYSLLLPNSSTMKIEELQKILVESGVFKLGEVRKSRSLQGWSVELKAENSRIGPMLIQRLAEETLSRLPAEVKVSCNPYVDATQF